MTTTSVPAPERWSAAGRPRQVLVGLAALALVGAAVAVPLAQGADEGATAALDPTTLVPSIGTVDADRFPERLGAVPAAGTVAQLPGPLDEGADLGGLALDPADGAAVGTARATRDVSTLLVLELRAGFYDEQGALLGTDRLVLRQPDFTRAFEAGTIDAQYGGALPFRLEPPATAAPAVRSALVTVPVLVHE